MITITTTDPGPSRQPWECPRCHVICAPHVDACERCAPAAPALPPPAPRPSPWTEPPNLPGPFVTPPLVPNDWPTWPTDRWTLRDLTASPCMFDGLPPGVYGLVCTCPRCTPRCSITTSTHAGEPYTFTDARGFVSDGMVRVGTVTGVQ